MVKIGIISMQRVMNHGSFLQAYALKKTVENSIPSAECVFIDLPPNGKEKSANSNTKTYLDMLRFWYHKLRKHEAICHEYCLRWNYQKFRGIYQECLKDYLGVTDSRNYNTDYDAVIIGSDEVFNCTQEDAWWGASMMLFGEGVATKKLISYAASFGYTTEERLFEFGLYEKVASNLCNFSSISVRDNNSEQIILKMVGEKPYKHLDPVFIYDFCKELEGLKIKKKKKKYLVIYQYQNRINDQQVINEIKKIARNTGCKILSVFEYSNWSDENVVCTPFEAMEYIRDAEYVITDTFHGCVMSIKYNKKFVALCRESNYNKLMDVLHTFRLEKQLLTGNEYIGDILNHKIDWMQVNRIIEKQREETISYLKSTLLEK